MKRVLHFRGGISSTRVSICYTAILQIRVLLSVRLIALIYSISLSLQLTAINLSRLPFFSLSPVQNNSSSTHSILCKLPYHHTTCHTPISQPPTRPKDRSEDKIAHTTIAPSLPPTRRLSATSKVIYPSSIHLVSHPSIRTQATPSPHLIIPSPPAEVSIIHPPSPPITPNQAGPEIYPPPPKLTLTYPPTAPRTPTKNPDQEPRPKLTLSISFPVYLPVSAEPSEELSHPLLILV